MADKANETGGVFESKDDEPLPVLARRGSNSAAALKRYVERMENLMKERAGIGESLKDLGQEIKSAGFDVAMVRKAVSLRKLDLEKRYALEQYCEALGVFG